MQYKAKERPFWTKWDQYVLHDSQLNTCRIKQTQYNWKTNACFHRVLLNWFMGENEFQEVIFISWLEVLLLLRVYALFADFFRINYLE